MGLYKNQNGVLIPIAGRGKAEYGASTIRTGTFTNPAVSAEATSGITITFDTPMPDADYEVDLMQDGYQSALVFWVYGKTATGFSVRFWRAAVGDIPANTSAYKYTAYKLYTDNEYNNILAAMPSTADSTYKLLGSRVPSFAVADDLYNFLVSCPPSSQIDFAIGSSALTVGDATFPAYTAWHFYYDSSGTVASGGYGYSYSQSNAFYKLGGAKNPSLALTIHSLSPIDSITSGSIQPVTSDAVYRSLQGYSFVHLNTGTASGSSRSFQIENATQCLLITSGRTGKWGIYGVTYSFDLKTLVAASGVTVSFDKSTNILTVTTSETGSCHINLFVIYGTVSEIS